MSTVWDWITSFVSWFCRYHIIFRTGGTVFFVAALISGIYAIQSSTWPPLALFAAFSTLGTFAIILTHPEFLEEH